MALPLPTGYTIDYIPTLSTTTSFNNVADYSQSLFYYFTNPQRWNKANVFLETSLVTNTVGPTPLVSTGTSLDSNGFLWLCNFQTGSRLFYKQNPTTFALISSFDPATNWNWQSQTYMGNTIDPETTVHATTLDAKIVCYCTFQNQTINNPAPNPFFGLIDTVSLANLGTYSFVLPVGTPSNYVFYQATGGFYILQNQQPMPILDDSGNAYFIANAVRSDTSVPNVFDWYVWKVALSTMTGVVWHFVGNSTVGRGDQMLYDSATNSLFVHSTTSRLFVVDCATGTLTNTVSGVFANTNEQLAIVSTQGRTRNGAFFTNDLTTATVKSFINASDLSHIGTFVDTSGVNWATPSPWQWAYFPSLNYIVATTTNNYPTGGGGTPAILIYKLQSLNTAAITQVYGGNFQDCQANPVTNGYLTVRLVSDSEQTTTGNGEVYSGVRKILHLDMTGNVAGTEYLWSNLLLNPVGSYYVFDLFDATGVRLWQAPLTGTIPNQATYNLAGLIRN